MANKKLPDVELKMRHGRPTVHIDGKPNACTTYHNFGQKSLQHTMAWFAKIPMDVYYITPARLPGEYNSSRFWVGDKVSSTPLVETSEEMYILEDQAEFILKNDPNAHIFLHILYAPNEAWKKKHLDEFFINEEGEMQDTPSLASDAYWEISSDFSAALIRFVESQPWADRVVGYANLDHGEGLHLPVGDGWLFDHSARMLEKYRAYIKKKYGNNKKLQQAHGDAKLTFKTIQVPKDKLRGSVPEVKQMLYWQAGPDNQALRDYLELNRDLYHHHFRMIGEKMAGAADRKVLMIQDALKQTMLGWSLKGFFGYPNFGGSESWSPAFPDFVGGSGCIEVARLDGTRGYDGLMTPHDYQARGLGGVYEPEGIVDSTILRRMFFSGHMDMRFRKGYGIGAAEDVREAEALMWRNFATTVTRGFNSHICWGFVVDDWFYCDPIKKTIRAQNRMMTRSLDWPHETPPGIALILDDAAVLETNGSGNYYNEAIMWEWKMGLARCGVPFRIYLFEDLELDDFPPHRVFYFPNLFRVDRARRRVLQKKVFRDGNIVVWGPGSGLSDGTSIGTASASRLTGFEFEEMMNVNASRRTLISNFDHPITRDLDEDTMIGASLPFGPVLYPRDGLQLGLAWAKGGMNHNGLSYKDFGKGAAGSPAGIVRRGDGDYAGIFSSAVQVPADLWRSIARHAGAHIYSEANDILMADSSVVALHSLKSGRKTIALPGKHRVTELTRGRLREQATSRINFVLKAPGTRVFHIEAPGSGR